MKKHSGFGAAPPRVDIEVKLIRYLTTHPEGVSTMRMNAWIDSCSRGGGYSFTEYFTALYSLRDSNRAAFANGVWYLRGTITVTKENT